MRVEIAIEGLGLVGAFGTGTDAFRTALSNGRCQPEYLPVDPDGGDVVCPVFRATTDDVRDYASSRELRRIDHFSRLAILGVGAALKDADMLKADRSKIGVVIGTGYGATATTFDFMDSMLDFGDACASPTRFSNSVHNAAAANVSITMKLQGVNLTVSQFDMSVPMALFASIEWLQTGTADTIVFGGVDEYCKPLGYCYKRFFGVQTEKMNPFDFSRQSAIPGEGAAFMVLRRLEDAKKAKAVIDSFEIGHGQCPLPKNGTVLIGADGHKASAEYYKAALVDAPDTRCFSAIYGSMPCGPAFDMAAATIELEDNHSPMHCLKYNCRGDYALVSLTREGPHHEKRRSPTR